jgi:cytochrome oxidase assembly protein ShyY1
VLWKPRWIAGHAVAVVVTVAFVALGFWQLARNHQKQDKIRAERAAYAAIAPDLVRSPVPVGQRVQASGVYDRAYEVLLRNQVRGDAFGTDVVTPLKLDDGTAVLVDRGWVADTTELPPPPAGRVVVRGPLNASRSLSPQDTVSNDHGRLSLPRVDVSRVETSVPYPLRTQWIAAQFQRPAPGPDDPQLPQPPSPDPVNHMQYAIEWFAFALIPVVGWPIVLWRVARRQPPIE